MKIIACILCSLSFSLYAFHEETPPMAIKQKAHKKESQNNFFSTFSNDIVVNRVRNIIDQPINNFSSSGRLDADFLRDFFCRSDLNHADILGFKPTIETEINSLNAGKLYAYKVWLSIVHNVIGKKLKMVEEEITNRVTNSN
ncbi:MAG: hypothetical protein KC505_00810 [Myxococcales bacterium]|nr:hypothetical protein [Myxococcales bacterium]USN51375.1 MAG: hypothetical protein H6731_02910 [Myxococcales bacterium]